MNKVLAEKIMEFQPKDGNWLELEQLLEQVFSLNNPQVYYPAIFNLFEHFPEEDGAGVFWSALHGMETVGGYERELVRFFRRSPCLMTEAMLIRLRNAGEKEVGGVSIDSLIGK